MKLDKASIKEIKHISLGICICDILMLIIYICLGYFDFRIILACLLGSIIAIIGFVWLCFSIQKTLQKKEYSKGMMTKSYLGRMVLYAGFVALVFKFGPSYGIKIAGTLPILFPSITIKAMNFIKSFKNKEEEKE